MDHIFNELLALTRAGLMDVPLETDIALKIGMQS